MIIIVCPAPSYTWHNISSFLKQTFPRTYQHSAPMSCVYHKTSYIRFNIESTSKWCVCVIDCRASSSSCLVNNSLRRQSSSWTNCLQSYFSFPRFNSGSRSSVFDLTHYRYAHLTGVTTVLMHTLFTTFNIVTCWTCLPCTKTVIYPTIIFRFNSFLWILNFIYISLLFFLNKSSE